MSRHLLIWCVLAFVVSDFGCGDGRVTNRTLIPQIDERGPYLIVATEQAAKSYQEAIEIAKSIHPQAISVTIDCARPNTWLKWLRKYTPRYGLVFILPTEFDTNFAWRWMKISTQIDDDPFVDVRCGFITGETPHAAKSFMSRIRDAVRGEISLPPALVDNLGPNVSAKDTMFRKQNKSFFLPVYAEQLRVSTISHGRRGFSKERLSSMAGAGIVHFGGHGYPDRVVNCLNGPYARRLALDPCVIFSGACYTGVTGRWFDINGPKVTEKHVELDKCFCLSMLSNNVLAYLAAPHPDHGIPVYQEMEHLAVTGATLGDLIKHTHDGVVLASGGQVPQFVTFKDGMARPAWTSSDFMLVGTASRVLFGDPSMRIIDSFAESPFELSVTETQENSLTVKAEFNNPDLRSTYTDTYFADLSANKKQFNDCARLQIPLPEGCKGPLKVDNVNVSSGGETLKHRLVGYAIEHDGKQSTLHVQIDVGTKGYMKSKLRKRDATVRFRVTW
ncbi:MAG: hypothetical protein KGZ25_05720 [Planctomycetes bacterium]|nr:hypothetical protein [Planctomycetota bacterium]